MGKLLSYTLLLLLLGGVVAGPLSASQHDDHGPGSTSIRARRAAIADDFPTSVHSYRAGHFLVFHDTDPQAARSTGALLSRTRQQFYQVITKAGFHVHNLNHRLVCLLFAHKTAFVHYGEIADHQDMSWSGGYYSSRTNRIALYEHSWMPRFANTTGVTAAGDDTATKPVPDTRQWAQTSIARTTHEAAHLLAFNSGLQKRGVMYPFWVSEGLATSFETEHPNQPFGPAEPNPVRQAGLLSAWHNRTLIPLKTFATMTTLPHTGPKTVNIAYSQAWGLFQYLYEHRTAALAAYLAQLAQEPVGWRPRSALRAEFVKVFGPTQALQAGWQAWLATLARTDGRTSPAGSG